MIKSHNTITMFYNYYDDYQYDSCVSKGICSVGPRTSSLQEVLIMYLKLLAFYTIELQNFGGKNKDAKNIILDTISALMSNMEYTNEEFGKTLISVKTILAESKRTYLKLCKEKEIEPKYIQSNIKLNSKLDITKLIQQGEREFAKRTEYLSPKRKNLFEIMAFVIKSLCVNVVELKSYTEDDEIENKGFHKILVLLNFLNYSDTNINDILDEIKESVKVDQEISKRIQELKIKRYGDPEENEVSLSTRPNKAILVAGTNIRELENVLEYTKDQNVDVYTHGEMILAHTYPKFKTYPHLIGHYGVGVENCLLDFATFPGAILITKHSTENIEYLYRGRLFTTDYVVPRGAVKIEDNDFSKLVESANSATGFKRGKIKQPIRVGCAKCDMESQLDSFLSNYEKYKHLIIIGPESYNQKNRIYFENILKNMPDDVFVISFSYKKSSPNIMYLNGTSEFSIIYSVLDRINQKLSENNSSIDISIFISKCDKHTISNIIYLKTKGIKNIYMSKCAPIMLNPILMNILAEHYEIISAEHPVDDLKRIIGNNT